MRRKSGNFDFDVIMTSVVGWLMGKRCTSLSQTSAAASFILYVGM